MLTRMWKYHLYTWGNKPLESIRKESWLPKKAYKNYQTFAKIKGKKEIDIKNEKRVNN